MSKFIAFDIDRKQRVSCGIVDQTGAVDLHPMVTITDPLTGETFLEPTNRIWPETSILIRDGLTMADVEKNIGLLVGLVSEQYDALSHLVRTTDVSATEMAELVWQARKKSGWTR